VYTVQNVTMTVIQRAVLISEVRPVFNRRIAFSQWKRHLEFKYSCYFVAVLELSVILVDSLSPLQYNAVQFCMYSSGAYLGGLAPLDKLFAPMSPCHQEVQFGTGQREVTLCGWKGDGRSGVALAMRHRLSGLSTYVLSGFDRAMSTSVLYACKTINCSTMADTMRRCANKLRCIEQTCRLAHSVEVAEYR